MISPAAALTGSTALRSSGLALTSTVLHRRLARRGRRFRGGSRGSRFGSLDSGVPCNVLHSVSGDLMMPEPRRKSNRIRTENERPGTTDWLLTNTRIDPATKYRCPWIEGYCSRTSLRAGETLEIMVS